MDHFIYRDGELHCERVPVSRIAEDVGTPTYIYSTATLTEHYREFEKAFAPLAPAICFSVKSCQNLAVLRHLVGLGAGMDVVSGGELYRALRAGADPARIVYAGVGKTDREITEAIDAAIGWFNVESEAELANLARIARARNRPVRAALRINPDVDPKTHRHTATGKRETKFGVDIERAQRIFAEYRRHPHVRLVGIHLHIGSPVYATGPYVEAISKALALIGRLRADGLTIEAINIGGGYGASYEEGQSPPPTAYAEAIVPLLEGSGLQLLIEPGRSIAANAGVLLGRTIYVKQSGEKQFVIVDAAMTELIRPALYDAFHFAWPACPGPEFMPPARRADLELPGTVEVDVVGPVCESADYLALGRRWPPIERGDLVAIFAAGAYGFVMASHYNARPNAAEILVDGDNYRLVRRRETYHDLIAAEENIPADDDR